MKAKRIHTPRRERNKGGPNSFGARRTRSALDEPAFEVGVLVREPTVARAVNRTSKGWRPGFTTFAVVFILLVLLTLVVLAANNKTSDPGPLVL